MAASPPYCVFRNPSGYNHNNRAKRFRQDTSHFQDATWRSDARRIADEHTAFYLDSVMEQPIPASLLADTIFDDLQRCHSLPAFQHRRNTLLHVEHGDTSLLLHAGGEFLDEVIVRNCHFLQPHYDWTAQPGFSLNIRTGSPILQLERAGRNKFGLSSNVLVRTRGELIHFTTVDVTELTGGAAQEYGHVLDPKNKWLIPEEIVDMTGSNTDWTFAYLVGKSGQLYSWNLREGVSAVGSKCLLPEESLSPQQVSPLVPPYMVESRLHPKQLYMTRGHQVFSIDTRSKRTSLVFTNEFVADSTDFNHGGAQGLRPRTEKNTNIAVHGICSHSERDHLYFVSTADSILLMDDRVPQSHIFKQSTYCPQNRLAFKRINRFHRESKICESIGKIDCQLCMCFCCIMPNCLSSILDVLLTSSTTESQCFAHTINFPHQQHGDGIISNSSHFVQQDVHNFDLLRAASPHGMLVRPQRFS
jgi:hypothetical protein